MHTRCCLLRSGVKMKDTYTHPCSRLTACTFNAQIYIHLVTRYCYYFQKRIPYTHAPLHATWVLISHYTSVE